jgi:tetratricopeptide (TPR) repeat protein
LAEFALAQRTSPNDAFTPFLIGMVERRQGRWDQCLQHIQQSLALDPHNLALVTELVTTYAVLRRYDESSKAADAALTWKPRDFSLSLMRAWNDEYGKADLARWKALVSGGADNPSDPNDLISARLNLALLQRDYRAAQQALDTPGLAESDDNGFFLPREWFQAIIARGLGDKARANEQWVAARQRAAAATQQDPADARPLIVLGQIDAALGHREDAIREGEHASELLPTSKDAINGGAIQEKLARIYAQAADANRAISFLEKMSKVPNGVSYGSLKLEEDWDPLRHDPRFDKIVQSLAPK